MEKCKKNGPHSVISIMKGNMAGGGGGQLRGSLWKPEEAPKPALEVASKPKPKGIVGGGGGKGEGTGEGQRHSLSQISGNPSQSPQAGVLRYLPA